MPIDGIELNVFSLTLIIPSLLSVYAALLTFERLSGAGKWFGMLMLSIALWGITYGFELASTSLDEMLFWIKLEYIGITSLSVFWIVFAMKYTGNEKWFSIQKVIALFILPFLTLLAVWTNDLHHLHYASVSVDKSGPIPLLSITPGPIYIIHTIYFYLAIGTGSVLLIFRYRRTEPIFRNQIGTILVATFIPWVVNIFYIFDFRPLGHIDLTPHAFIITSILVSFSLLKFKLFDITPVARERVIEVMNEGLMVLDFQNRVVDINPRMKQIMPGNYKRVAGYRFGSLPIHSAELDNRVSKRHNGNTGIELEHEGEKRYYDVDATFLFNKQQVYTGAILLFKDVSDNKKAKEELQRQANALSALNNTKDRIFSIISHDLRSPLFNLLSMLQFAEEGKITGKEFKQFLPNLSKDVNYTSELLENLLYWSKSQLKGEMIIPSEFSLYDIVDHKQLFFEKRLKDKSILLTKKKKKPCMVYADMEMMRIVIRNLVSNAIKFTPKNGRIDISAEETGNTVQVQIKDTGVGIEDKDVAKLFSEEIFTSRGTDNEIGTGLGLLLCKEFIEKSNGKIRYSPNIPSGSIFTFTLPKTS